MKNFIKLISMILVFVLVATTFVACGEPANGVDGVDGINGINGVDGKDGKDGIDGKDGKDGADGKDGKSAYELAVDEGFNGTLQNWLDSLKGEDGAAGAAGAAGATGAKGDKGDTGVGIKSAKVEFVEGGYKLIFTLDNGEELEVPVIAPTKVETAPETVTPEGSTEPVEVSKLANEAVVNDTSANGYTATVPAGTLLETGATEVQLIIEVAEANANIKVNADTTEKKALDIKVEGVSEYNDQVIIITLPELLEKNLINVALYHGDDAMTKAAKLADVDAHNEFYYDAETGDVTIATKSFSNFTYTYAKGVEVSADGKTYTVFNANGYYWVEAQTDDFFSGKTVALGADIDFNGAEIKPILFWNPENRIVFDGNNKTLKNFKITANSGAEGQSLFNGTLDVKNLNVDGATIKGRRASAVIGGKIYGNIENCTVKNATVTDYYWQAGILAGQFNAGNIINCTIEDSKIYCASATGIVTGITNETAGTRKYENVTVKNCDIIQTGSFGVQSGYDYDSTFGAITGCIWTANTNVYFNNCVVENCTMLNATVENAEAEAFESLFGGPIEDGNVVYIDNVKQEAPSTEEVA